MLAEGSFLSVCVLFFPFLALSPSTSPLSSIPPCFSAHPSFPSPAHPLLSRPPRLPGLSVSFSALTPSLSLSSPEVELPIMIKWTVTAWTSAEEWTLLRGFILLSAEIQREQQNDELRQPRTMSGWILTAVKSGRWIWKYQKYKRQNDTMYLWTW